MPDGSRFGPPLSPGACTPLERRSIAEHVLGCAFCRERLICFRMAKDVWAAPKPEPPTKEEKRVTREIFQRGLARKPDREGRS